MGNDQSSIQSVKLEHFHYTGKAAKDVYGIVDRIRVGSVSFDPTVSVIGNRAFGDCSNLQSIEIPATITRINDRAFVNCSKLKSVMIPDTITHIGDHVFEWCESLEEVTLPPSITTMGDRVFDSCLNLKRVKILSKITSIPWLTFKKCSSLQSVTMASTITSIGTDAFRSCHSLDAETYQRIANINAGRPHQSDISKAPANRSWKVFISHSNKDSSLHVFNIVKTHMKAKGHDVFNPTTHLASEYDKVDGVAMQDAVKKSKIIFAAISEEFFKSPWCQLEIEAAKEKNIKVVPVFSGDVYGKKQIDEWIIKYKETPLGYIFKENVRDVLNSYSDGTETTLDHLANLMHKL